MLHCPTWAAFVEKAGYAIEQEIEMNFASRQKNKNEMRRVTSHKTGPIQSKWKVAREIEVDKQLEHFDNKNLILILD